MNKLKKKHRHLYFYVNDYMRKYRDEEADGPRKKMFLFDKLDYR